MTITTPTKQFNLKLRTASAILALAMGIGGAVWQGVSYVWTKGHEASQMQSWASGVDAAMAAHGARLSRLEEEREIFMRQLAEISTDVKWMVRQQQRGGAN